ncbi:TIGR03089 family protein [Sporichthya brevicatena]|uniref:TIGR03089 family protein n=2 Tax=Sporichthya brevicatena TaxID=171442 RepID=A0ABN1G6B8_9ACTN
MTPADLLRAAARPDPARPFVTFYDDATGERVELSFTTADNWIAKTANMIVEDLAARPGDRIALLLPTHWQTVVWYLACWTAGVVVAPDGDPTEAEHVVTDPDGVERAAACRGERVLVPMRPFGAPALELPAGFYDYAAEVPAYGDQFAPWAPVSGEDAALVRAGGTATGADLVAVARATATEWGLTGADRVLVTAELRTPEGLMAGLLAPLAVGASVVLCRNADPAALPRRIETERVTRTLPPD